MGAKKFKKLLKEEALGSLRIVALCLPVLLSSSCTRNSAQSSMPLPEWGVAPAYCDVVKEYPKPSPAKEGDPCLEIPAPGQHLDLFSLVQVALKNNPQGWIAWAEYSVAQAELGQAEAGYYPELLYTAGVKREKDIAGEGRSSFLQTNYEQDVQLEYLFLDFGARSAQAEEAFMGQQAANLNYTYVLQSIVVDVASAYYQTVQAEALVRSRRSDLENAGVTLDAADALFEAGLNTLTDVLQAKANLANYETLLQEALGQEELAKAQLNFVLGIPVDCPVKIQAVSEKLPMQVVSENVCRLMELAETHRADLAEYRVNVQGKQAGLKKAKADGLPRVGFKGDVAQVVHRPDPVDYAWSASLGVNFPLFSGYFYQEGVCKALADLAKAQSQLQEKENSVMLQVKTAFTQFQVAVATLGSSEQFLEFAEEAYEVALANYKSGVGSFPDLISAQSSLADARTQFIEARSNWYLSISNLAYATGTISLPPQGLDHGLRGAQNKYLDASWDRNG